MGNGTNKMRLAPRDFIRTPTQLNALDLDQTDVCLYLLYIKMVHWWCSIVK